MASVASFNSRFSTAESIRVNTPYKSNRSNEAWPSSTNLAATRSGTRNPAATRSDTRFYPTPISSPSDKAAANSTASNVKIEKMQHAPRFKIAVLLLLLALTSCTAAVGYFSPRTVLSKVGLVAFLHQIGVAADPELQAKIVDLSKQIEDLQRMVTLLIPEQQQRIEQIQLLQIEQQQKQLEQERRESEQREEEQKRKEDEMKRAEEERRKEEEREKARELDKIRQLEEQKMQLELELHEQEEERRRRQEEEEEKQNTETPGLGEEEDEEEGDLVANTCDSSDEHVRCEAGGSQLTIATATENSPTENSPTENSPTENSPTENSPTETIGSHCQQEMEALKAGLQEEKARLQEEMVNWENFKSRTMRASQRRSKAANLLLSEVKEREKKDIEDQATGVSEAVLARLDQMELENTRLRELVEQIEAQYREQVEGILGQIEGIKEQLATEDQDESNTNGEDVMKLINTSLELFAADRVGMPDYALESSGAVVFTIGETEPYTRDTPWMGIFGISIWRSCKTPRLAIQKDNSPGNCWSFTGTKGTLTIQLSAQVFPEYFTVDHIPRELAPNKNASSAPSHFRVLGLDYGNAPKGHVLGNYQFTELPIQTFAVQQNPYEKYFRFIRVEILSNQGNKDYTCLYRFRVHGRPHDTDTYNG